MNYLGLNKDSLGNCVEWLNDLLANYHIYYQNLRCHHWYVEGQNFFELHQKFEELYNQAKVDIDDIAERILTLRFYPEGRLSEYLQRSEIKENGKLKGDTDMVNQVLHSHKILISCMRSVIEAADKASDEGTIDLIGSKLEALEKNSWMLDAWLSRVESKTTQHQA